MKVYTEEHEFRQLVRIIENACKYTKKCKFNAFGVSERNRQKLLEKFNKGKWRAKYYETEQYIYVTRG
jgi:hypothetical protein